MLTFLSMAVIFMLAKRWHMNPWLWMLATAFVGVVVSLILFHHTGLFLGGCAVFMPMALIMLVANWLGDQDNIIDVYIEENNRAIDQARAVASEHYPDDLEVVMTFMGADFQAEFTAMRNHLIDHGIKTYVKTAGMTNLMVRRADLERALQLIDEQDGPTA